MRRLGVLIALLLGSNAACSFPDPTFADGAGGSGGSAGNTTVAGSAPCTSGCEPQLVARGQGEVTAIAANDSHVYWISKLEADDSAELRSTKLGTNAVEVVGSEGLGWSAGVLAVDVGSAFIANQSSGGALVSLRLRDGFLEWTYMQERIDTIVLSGAMLYYSAPYAVVRLPKEGPNTGGRRDLTDAGGPRLLMLDDEHLILLDQSEERLPPRRVVRLRADGSEAWSQASVVLDDAPDFESACADAEAYYFAAPDEGKVVRLRRTDPAALETLAEDEAGPRKLSLHAGALYWTTSSGSQLRRLVLPGEAPVTLDQAVPSVLTGSDRGVHWATPSGEIRSLGP